MIAISAVVNLVVSTYLYRQARAHDSPALEGDAAHLRADAATSLAVLLGLVLIEVTGFEQLDSIVALMVASAIVYTGVRILTRSSRVLMDEALPQEELDIVRKLIADYPGPELEGFHKLRGRRAGQRAVHRPAPAVRRGHVTRARARGRARAAGRGARSGSRRPTCSFTSSRRARVVPAGQPARLRREARRQGRRLTAADRPTKASTALYPSYPLTSSSSEAIAQMPVTVIQAARERLMSPCIVPQREVGLAGLSCDRCQPPPTTSPFGICSSCPPTSGAPCCSIATGRCWPSAGQLAADDLAAVGQRLAADAGAAHGGLSPNGAQPAIEIDVLSTGGAMFLLGEADLMMACVTNRNVHPGLIFYDMHAVLRDLERAPRPSRCARGHRVKRRGGRLGGYADEVAAAMRRRKEVRRPRVRIRLDHGEARLLDDRHPRRRDC